MTIFELALMSFNAIGTTASIFGGINALRDLNNSTAVDLFKKSFVDAVKQNASDFADLTDPETVDVDNDALDEVIASLEGTNVIILVSPDGSETLAKIVTIFQKCIILPGHQLTAADLERRLQPVIKKTFAIFFEKLPRNQQATNETMLEFARGQSARQEGLIKDTQVIKENANQIGKINKTTQAIHDKLHRPLDINISAAVEEEQQSAINNAKDLLRKNKPQSAIDSLENLKQRIWTDASPAVKFSILTNMAAALFTLNKEQEAAMLVLEAFQYNPEDEKALSNRALAHASLGEMKEAEEYAKKALEKNPVNTKAYTILVEISTDEETLEEVIAKVPEYLQEKPQIAYAISNIAKQHGDLEKARKWRETVVASDQENAPDFKAALATILIEQVTDDDLAVSTNQLSNLQIEQLEKAIKFLTEAWDSVADTELRTARIEWVINRSTAQHLLGNSKEVIKDLDTALEIGQPNPILLKNRAILAFEQGEEKSSIEFLEKIQSAPETPEAPIALAGILFVYERYNEAITTLNDFLRTNPSAELQENANRLLIQIYIADKRFEEAQQISTIMLESSPTSVLNLVNAARISSATEESEEALSQLKEAYNLAQNSGVFQEIFELASELYKHEQFKEAAALYEKLADTSHDSQWTQLLLYSYYRSGEAAKALEICQGLREKDGPLENVSKIEFGIYEEIGDLNQALIIGEAYLSKFPDDIDMQIDLAYVHYCLNNMEEFNRLLERSFDLKELSLPTCFNLAHLHQVGSKPENALDIMYETRRTHYDKPAAHLKYIGLFFQVSKQLDELLNPTQVQPDTAVCIDSSGQSWSIIEERAGADITRNERDFENPLVQQLLGKTVNDEIHLGETPLGSEIGKITAIESKYVYAYKESLSRFSELFPGTPGLWSVSLDEPSGDSEDNSHEEADSADIQPILDLTDKQHEASLQIEEGYKKMLPPIGVLTKWTGRGVLDAWNLLMSRPDLGIRCSVGDFQEKRQALALFESSQPKLIVDIISLMTLYCLEATDTVVKAFGKLGIAQSTIDVLQRTIFEREGTWSERESMSIERQGNQYVRINIDPEDVRQNIERLEDLVKWIRENCEVHPCTAALQMNLLRKRELDDLFQPFFIDTLLIASQPGCLLLSDDERLRFYAKTGFNSDAGTNFHIDGVWTQVVLEHCVNKNLLSRVDYNKMTIKLVCSNYYHTEFDAEVLIEAAKQSDWKFSEPYNSLVKALGGQRANLSFALNVATDFLFELWTQPIVHSRSVYLTHALLDGLTFGRRPRSVLMELANRVLHRFEFHPLAQREVLSLIRANALTRIF